MAMVSLFIFKLITLTIVTTEHVCLICLYYIATLCPFIAVFYLLPCCNNHYVCVTIMIMIIYTVQPRAINWNEEYSIMYIDNPVRCVVICVSIATS